MNLEAKKFFNRELEEGIIQMKQRNYTKAYEKFENAHILGQSNVKAHVISHYMMLKVAISTFDILEILGQIILLPLAIIGSSTGLLPVGNNGRARGNWFKSKKVPKELLSILKSENKKT